MLNLFSSSKQQLLVFVPPTKPTGVTVTNGNVEIFEVYNLQIVTVKNVTMIVYLMLYSVVDVSMLCSLAYSVTIM